MKASIKKLPKSQVEIKISISTEEFKNFTEKATLNLGKELEIEGFRKGKAPKEVIVKKIGQEKILKETIDLAIKENYLKVILENKIEVLGKPEIKILKFSENSLEFKAKAPVMPEVKLPDYKKIAPQVKRKKISISEKEVEDAISWLQKSRAKFTFKNQPAQKGDFLEIDFQSPQIEAGARKKDGFILGQGHFVSGFEENLEGMVSGQEKEFSLEFPKNYFRKDLAGRTVDFKVKVNSVQKIELPEINDQWACNLGNFENLASLKKSIREGLNLEKEKEERLRVRQEIMAKTIKESESEIPETLIESEKNQMLEELKTRVSQILKISLKEYLDKIKKTEKELKESFFPEAQKRIKYSLVLREISKREKIEVSEEEIKTETNKVLKNYPIEKVKKLDLKKLKLYIEDTIRNEKTFQFLESLTK
ncbi:trigger factor [Patescibacteria group bacterium]|nr:trigger factor [Patescibacteria group bacterium]